MVKKKTRTKREFKGSTVTFLILFCFGVIPALFYYWIKCEKVEVVEETEEE